MDRLLELFSKLRKKGFFHLIVSNYSVQFIVFGSHLLIAKIMTPSDVGIIKTIETFVNMAIVLGGGGVIFAILKVIPEHQDLNIRNLSLRFSLKYVAVFSLCVLVIFNLIAYLGLISQDEKLVFWFHQYSLIIIPSVIVMLLIRYYQAIDMFKKISSIIFYLKLVSAVFVLGFTYFFFIKGYVLAMIITTTAVMLMLLYDIRKTIFGGTISEEYNSIKGKIVSLSKTAFLAQIIDQFKLHSGFLIANYVIYDRIMFGHYAFALILIQGLNIILTSVQQFIIPKMSEVSNSLEYFFEKFRKIELRFIGISTIIFLGTELFLPLVVTLVFGSKYDEAIPLLRIMLLGWYIQSFYALKGVVFLSLGKMKFISYASLTIFLVSVPIMYLLNSKFGALGAAWAFLFQNVVSFFVLTYFVRKVARQQTNKI